MPATADQRDALLRLHLTPGLGPVLIHRLIETLGSAEAAARASAAELAQTPRLGKRRARKIVEARPDIETLAKQEAERAASLGVRLLTIFDEGYPPLLKQLSDAPPILYVKGEIDPEADQHPVAIVGSRGCTAYGVEQAERFAAILAQCGLTIVSGGARGIDSAAHRAALRAGGRTTVVAGSGLAKQYPPENRDMFERIADGRGAVISELPLETNPAAENFPSRNRIISGLCLGVLVVEAAKGSGALITARYAAEDHGREVLAVPGRVDSPASEGALELLKKGEAAVATCPGDVIDLLEAPARHLYAGVHADRYADPAAVADGEGQAVADEEGRGLFDRGLTDTQRVIVESLDEPMDLEELVRRTGLTPAVLRAEATLLEIRGVLARRGDRLTRRSEQG